MANSGKTSGIVAMSLNLPLNRIVAQIYLYLFVELQQDIKTLLGDLSHVIVPHRQLTKRTSRTYSETYHTEITTTHAHPTQLYLLNRGVLYEFLDACRYLFSTSQITLENKYLFESIAVFIGKEIEKGTEHLMTETDID